MEGKSSGTVLDVARQRGGAQPGVVSLLDRSRFGNDGAMTNVTWTQLPTGLWVMGFNGATSTVDCGHSESLRLTSEVTMMAWVLFTDFSGHCPVIFMESGGQLGYCMGAQQTTGNIFVIWADNTGGHLWGPAIPMPAGIWVFLAVTIRSGMQIVYVNGVNAGNLVVAYATLAPANHDLGIGVTSNLIDAGGGGDFSGHMNGQIVLDRVKGYALTPAQIRSKFAATRRLFGV